MPRIKSESLQEGMLVSNDVKNINDMLLIPAGCALTERHINILQAWGVAEIEVQNSDAIEDTDPLTKLAPGEVAKLTAEVKSLFWRLDGSNPVQNEIFKLILQRQAGKIAGGHVNDCSNH
jgi:hypothetical protein